MRRALSNPAFDARINILGTINILQNGVKYKVKKVIFASSVGAVYGEQQSTENHPLSPYGITRLTAEYYLYYYKTVCGLDHTILRYANVYDPRQDPYGEADVVAIFIQKMLNKEQLIINGDGKQTRDFVYVGDVVEDNMLAIGNNLPENVFNIGTGIETYIMQIFDYLREIVKPENKREV